MRSIISFLSLWIFTATLIGLADELPSARPKTYAETKGQAWLTNYYGKTLKSLGELVAIRVERQRDGVSSFDTNWMDGRLKQLTESSRIQDYYSMGVAGVPPFFTLEYASGLRVRGSRYAATIILKDGREGPVALADMSADQPKRSFTTESEILAISRKDQTEALRIKALRMEVTISEAVTALTTFRIVTEEDYLVYAHQIGARGSVNLRNGRNFQWQIEPDYAARIEDEHGSVIYLLSPNVNRESKASSK